MQLEMVNKGSHLLVVASGKLDAVTSDNFTEAVSAGLDNTDNVIVDFKELEYISSSGLRSLLLIAKKAAAKKGFFAVCGLQGPVMDVFKMSGFDKMLKIFDTPETASEKI